MSRAQIYGVVLKPAFGERPDTDENQSALFIRVSARVCVRPRGPFFVLPRLGAESAAFPLTTMALKNQRPRPQSPEPLTRYGPCLRVIDPTFGCSS